jgi:hypothetical protein
VRFQRSLQHKFSGNKRYTPEKLGRQVISNTICQQRKERAELSCFRTFFFIFTRIKIYFNGKMQRTPCPSFSCQGGRAHRHSSFA